MKTHAREAHVQRQKTISIVVVRVGGAGFGDFGADAVDADGEGASGDAVSGATLEGLYAGLARDRRDRSRRRLLRGVCAHLVRRGAGSVAP